MNTVSNELRYESVLTDVGVLDRNSEDRSGDDIYATIEVKPPLESVGPAFSKVVLGRESHKIYFEEIVTNDRATYFLARDEACELPIKERVERFSLLANRIGMMATWADASSLYMFNSTFPKV